MTDIAKKLRALADEIDNLADSIDEPKSKSVQPWPPKGLALEVDVNCNHQYLPRMSAGDGFYCYPQGGLQSLKDVPWRYAPAPWDIAPSSGGVQAWGWVITSVGECLWTWDRYLKVGDEWSWGNGNTIVHVEYRPETEEARG